MKRLICLSALFGAAFGANGAVAHGVAGARVFVATLTIDDPAVSDEASLPTITYQRSGADGGPGPIYQANIGWEFDKRVTETFGFAVNDAYNVVHTAHAKTQTGFEDLSVTAKYQVYVNPEHEFMASLGVIREFGRTGTAHIGADEYGSTTPTVYFGKGLGDLPIGMLRPLAVTGTFGYTVADMKLKAQQPCIDPIDRACRASSSTPATKTAGSAGSRCSTAFRTCNSRYAISVCRASSRG